MKAKNIKLNNRGVIDFFSLQHFSSTMLVLGVGAFINIIRGFGWGVSAQHKLFQGGLIYKSFKSLRPINKFMH